MSNLYKLPEKNRKYKEASEWIAKLDRGLCEAEESELKDWLSDSKTNYKHFMEVAMEWDQLNDLSRLSDLFPETPVEKMQTMQWSRGMAAVLVLVVFCGYLLTQMILPVSEEVSVELKTEGTSVFETAVGEQSTIVLEDGSTAVLNTNSLLKVSYTELHRTLILERGEMHVSVAPNPNRPLTVIAADQLVQAVGTAFSVEIHEDRNIEVVVTEGIVRVAAAALLGGHSLDSEALVLPASSKTLAQGEEAHFGSEKKLEVREVSDEEINVRLAWREGDVIFRGEPLSEAMTEVSRYTNIEFVFLNDQLKQERIIGRFKTGDIDGLLATLSENLSITYQRTSDGRVLLGSL